MFAFKKTLVARLRARGVDMELVSELRTSAGKLELTGEGRQGNVQPDYVVRRLGDRASVYVNPQNREELEWTVPELLRSGAVETLVLT